MDNNNYLGFLKGRRGLLTEDADIINYEGDGVKPGMEAKDEKETCDPEEHIEGTGTEQAGTSDSDSFAGMADDLDDLLALEEDADLTDATKTSSTSSAAGIKEDILLFMNEDVENVDEASTNLTRKFDARKMDSGVNQSMAARPGSQQQLKFSKPMGNAEKQARQDKFGSAASSKHASVYKTRGSAPVGNPNQGNLFDR